MTKTSVYNQLGEKVADLDLNPRIFGVEKIDTGLVYLAVKAQRNNSRAAIAHTKNRSEVAGSGKKPWKQKGTGRARAGSVRSPLWRKGGVTFGPRSNRNFSEKMNRSAFRKALFTVLSEKTKDNHLIILEKLEDTSKTKQLNQILMDISAKTGLGEKFVLVVPDNRADLVRATKNLENVKVIKANHLNVLDLINNNTVILKDALAVIERTYLKV